MLKECNLDTTYTIKDIVENKDNILENENAINYILSKPDDYLEAFANLRENLLENFEKVFLIFCNR